MWEFGTSDRRERVRLPGRRELLWGLGAILVGLIVWSWQGTVHEEIALARLRATPGVTIIRLEINHKSAALSNIEFLDQVLLSAVKSKHPEWMNALIRSRLAFQHKLVRVNDKVPSWVFAEVAKLNGVSTLDLSNSSVTDETIAEAIPRRFRGNLMLFGTAVSDRGLHRIEGCRVQHLDLTGTHVTDAGFASIETFRELKSLGISSTNITGVTLSKLQRLPGLVRLSLSKTSVTDRSLAGLSGHPGLCDVDLSSTRVGDESLAVLATMPNRGIAILSDTQVTGTGLSHLARGKPWLNVQLSGCPLKTEAVVASNLESTYLRLDGTPLDDGIVPWLLSRSRLKSVRLDQSAVTNRGLAALANPRRGFGFSLEDTAIDDAGVAAYYLGEGYSVPDSGEVEQRSLLITEIAAAHATVPARIKLSAWSLRGTCVSPDVLSVLEP